MRNYLLSIVFMLSVSITFGQETLVTSKESNIEAVYETLKNKLIGKWTSKAWDGILKEHWYMDNNGDLKQKAKYFEKGKLLYEATNKVEIIDNTLILITVIKNSNPKVFRATSYNEKRIIFENSEYKNPSKVVYNLTSKNQFERELIGIENDKPSNYTFYFKREKK